MSRQNNIAAEPFPPPALSPFRRGLVWKLTEEKNVARLPKPKTKWRGAECSDYSFQHRDLAPARRGDSPTRHRAPLARARAYPPISRASGWREQSPLATCEGAAARLGREAAASPEALQLSSPAQVRLLRFPRLNEKKSCDDHNPYLNVRHSVMI